MTEKPNPNENIGKIDNPDLASTNFFWTVEVNGEVFNLQTTVRATQTQAQADAHIATVMSYIGSALAVDGHAKQVGRTPAESGNVSIDLNSSNKSAAMAAERGAEGMFRVEWIEVEAKAKDGEIKHYFKVGGGNYSQFGVRVWDETLKEAEIDPVAVVKASEKQNKLRLPVQKEYRAYFSKNADGTINKVVVLEPLS